MLDASRYVAQRSRQYHSSCTCRLHARRYFIYEIVSVQRILKIIHRLRADCLGEDKYELTIEPRHSLRP